jgi:hypothetical protein
MCDCIIDYISLNGNQKINLLRHGAIVNVQGCLGNTPLHYVRSLEMFNLLFVRYHADQSILNKQGLSPMGMIGEQQWSLWVVALCKAKL